MSSTTTARRAPRRGSRTSRPVEVDRRRAIVVVADGADAALDAVLAEIDAVRASATRATRARPVAHARRDDARDAVWVLAELGLGRSLRAP